MPKHHVDWRPDGEQLAEATGAGQVIIYRAADLQIVKRIEAHRGAASCVQWSHDQSRLATAGKDGTVVLWDTESFARLGELPNTDAAEILSLAWSPDDVWLAATDAGDVSARRHSILQSAQRTREYSWL